jgi:hypothetical protein
MDERIRTNSLCIDLNRNKTVWHNFEQKISHGFKVKQAHGQGMGGYRGSSDLRSHIEQDPSERRGVSFVRYADHGKDGVEFSTSTGRMPSTTTNIPKCRIEMADSMIKDNSYHHYIAAASISYAPIRSMTALKRAVPIVSGKHRRSL